MFQCDLSVVFTAEVLFFVFVGERPTNANMQALRAVIYKKLVVRVASKYGMDVI
jgi:hypothetical protein